MIEEPRLIGGFEEVVCCLGSGEGVGGVAGVCMVLASVGMVHRRAFGIDFFDCSARMIPFPSFSGVVDGPIHRHKLANLLDPAGFLPIMSV